MVIMRPSGKLSPLTFRRMKKRATEYWNPRSRRLIKSIMHSMRKFWKVISFACREAERCIYLVVMFFSAWMK